VIRVGTPGGGQAATKVVQSFRNGRAKRYRKKRMNGNPFSYRERYKGGVHIERPEEISELKIVTHDLGMDIESAYIIPLACLHAGEGFYAKKFKGYSDWILERHNAFCVVLGDVIGNSIEGSVGGSYGHLRPDQQKDLAEETLRPLAEAGKILAWVDGNHERRTSKKVDQFIGKDICKFLGIADVYDPDAIYMFLSVGYDRNKGQRNRNVYTGYMLHGTTGSKRIGGKANAMEDMARSIHADFYFSAHAHQKLMFPTAAVIPETRSKNLKFKKRNHVMAGSFQKWADYAIRAGFSPTPMGSPRLRLDGLRHDHHVSI